VPPNLSIDANGEPRNGESENYQDGAHPAPRGAHVWATSMGPRISGSIAVGVDTDGAQPFSSLRAMVRRLTPCSRARALMLNPVGI
jgi:hypothetical protein